MSVSIKEKSWRNFHPRMDNDLESNLGLYGIFTLLFLQYLNVYKEYYPFFNRKGFYWTYSNFILQYFILINQMTIIYVYLGY